LVAMVGGSEGGGGLGRRGGDCRREVAGAVEQRVELAAGVGVAPEVGQDCGKESLALDQLGMLGRHPSQQELSLGEAALLPAGGDAQQGRRRRPGLPARRLGGQPLALPEAPPDEGLGAPADKIRFANPDG
jgi:hypothetical protein